MDRVNCPIPLAETHIEIIGDNRNLEQVPAKVVLNLSPVPRVIIDLTPHLVSLVYLKIPHTVGSLLKIRTPSGAEIEVSITKWSINGRYWVRLVPTQELVTAIRTNDKLQSVKFNVMNFPEFNCKLSPGDQTCTVRLQTSTWRIEIKAVPETSKAKRRLDKESGYGITHEGTIRRSGGKLFSVEEVQELLYGLHLFLSFARGASCGVTLISGNDRNGEKVWEQWGVYPTYSWFSVASWLDPMNGEALSKVFPGFWKRFAKQPTDDTVRVALYWYLCSNESNALEAGIIHTQAALERLTHEIVGEKKEDQTGVWIGKALKAARIEPKIPQGCKALEACREREGFHDVSHTLTAIRNHLMHPKKRSGICVDDYSEAWDVGQRYVELLLLKLFEFDGPCMNRLGKYEGKFESEVVPWAQDVEDTK